MNSSTYGWWRPGSNSDAAIVAVRAATMRSVSKLLRGLVGAEQRHRVAPHHLLVHAHVAAAKDVLRVGGDHVGEAEAGPDLGAVLAHDVEDPVLAVHLVQPHAQVEGQSRRRAPRVLNVDADVAVVGLAGVHGDRALVTPVERHGPRGWVVRVDEPLLLEHEAVVHVLCLQVVSVARRREEPGLELVGPAPAFLEPGEVAADDDL
jgi:hypothetical protein